MHMAVLAAVEGTYLGLVMGLPVETCCRNIPVSCDIVLFDSRFKSLLNSPR